MKCQGTRIPVDVKNRRELFQTRYLQEKQLVKEKGKFTEMRKKIDKLPEGKILQNRKQMKNLKI